MRCGGTARPRGFWPGARQQAPGGDQPRRRNGRPIGISPIGKRVTRPRGSDERAGTRNRLTARTPRTGRTCLCTHRRVVRQRASARASACAALGHCGHGTAGASALATGGMGGDAQQLEALLQARAGAARARVTRMRRRRGLVRTLAVRVDDCRASRARATSVSRVSVTAARQGDEGHLQSRTRSRS